MNARLRNTTVAIVLAIVATMILVVYLNSLQSSIADGAETVPVLTAKAPIAAGTGGAELLLRVEKSNIPKKFVAGDAIADEAEIKKGTLVIAVAAGEQITKNKLRRSAVSEISYRLSGDKVAIAIPVDEVTGVAGSVKPGDRVAIYATFSPGPGGADLTQALLGDVEVISSADSDIKQGKISTSGGMKKTITLALAPIEAEKIVFAQEKGKIWVALLPAAGPPAGIKTSGQTMETIFH